MRSSKTPVVDRICHSATSNTGPSSRCSERGTSWCSRCACRSPRGDRRAPGPAGETRLSTATGGARLPCQAAPKKSPAIDSDAAAVGSDRNIAHQRDAVQDAIAVDVLEVAWGEVQCGPVVPERNASRCPLESHGVLGAGDLLEQQVEHVPAFAGCEVDDLTGEGRVDVDALVQPVSGWTRTTGWIEASGLVRTRSPIFSELRSAATVAPKRCSARSSSMKPRTDSESPA